MGDPLLPSSVSWLVSSLGYTNVSIAVVKELAWNKNSFTFLFRFKAKDAEERGDYNAMESNRRMALICNMVAVGVSAIIIILAIILLAVSFAAN